MYHYRRYKFQKYGCNKCLNLLILKKLIGLTSAYEPDDFCQRQHRQINVQANLIKGRCAKILEQVTKIKGT